MKGKKGITLIALVVTIVVLIILAGITINGIINGGIIKSAEDFTNHLNERVENDMENFNQLFNELQEGTKTDYSLSLLDKTETSIKVAMNGKNLKEYQYSLDGNTWTKAQDTATYNFTGLEKVTVDENTYATKKGKSYKIYAKGKDKTTNEEITCNPITATLDVEVVATTYYFTYEDLGNEIKITGRRPLTEFTNIPDGQDTITIPSYISGKPVTKIDLSFFKLVTLSSAELDTLINNIHLNVMDSNNNIIMQKAMNSSDFIKDSGSMTYSSNSIPIATGSNYQFYVSSGFRYGKSTNTMMGGQTSTVTISMDTLHKIIIPPTVKQIVNNMQISATPNENKSIIGKQLLNSKQPYFVQKIVDDNLTLFKLVIKINDGEFWEGGTSASGGHILDIKIVGKKNISEISNGDLINQMINKTYGNNQEDYWEFKVKYQMIF